MATKLIPRLQDGGMLMKYPSMASQQKLGSSLVEQQLLKARNAQAPPMKPIAPIALNNSYAGQLTGLGNAPGTTFDTKSLAGAKGPVGALAEAAPKPEQIIAGVNTMATMGIDAFSKDTGVDEFGIKKPEAAGATVGKSALSGASTGAQVGSMLGPWGAVGGALIGGTLGFFKGKKDAKEGEKQFNSAHSAAYGQFYGNQYANQFAAMKGKDGMKLKTANVMKNITPSTTLVPKLKHGGPINVIAAGKLHKENNNLGNGDKGIPVVNKKGRKIFELEKEEWIINLKATKQIEELVKKYNASKDDSTLETLGKLVHSELTTNTQDNSNKFGLEV